MKKKRKRQRRPIVCETKVKKLRGFELGYVVGLLEGEGWIGYYKDKRKRNKILVNVRIANTEKAIVEKFKSIVGTGYIYVGKKKEGRKKLYMFTLHKTADVLSFLNQIESYIYHSLHKKRAKQAIRYCKKIIKRNEIPIKKEILQKFHEQGLSVAKISKISKYPDETIRRWMVYYNIPRLQYGEWECHPKIK